MTGGCQCGGVRYAVLVDDDDAYLCHCRMCQRATGGVFAALKQVSRAALRWTTREPDRRASSAIAQRGFCRDCGTPLTYEGNGADQLDLTVGSFDDARRLRPVGHFGVESRHAAWCDTAGLPEKRTDEIPHLVAKWMETSGKLPD
ncbi:GFA family protein [Sphingomonas yunnanensis]|uniref:GFA family protein n=1 Tax=Sphingomonas yunnanensis TaxID=310400 RepID=UPI0031BA3BFE